MRNWSHAFPLSKHFLFFWIYLVFVTAGHFNNLWFCFALASLATKFHNTVYFSLPFYYTLTRNKYTIQPFLNNKGPWMSQSSEIFRGNFQNSCTRFSNNFNRSSPFSHLLDVIFYFSSQVLFWNILCSCASQSAMTIGTWIKDLSRGKEVCLSFWTNWSNPKLCWWLSLAKGKSVLVSVTGLAMSSAPIKSLDPKIEESHSLQNPDDKGIWKRRL